jgi:orotate phosphoribosyltransferase
MAVAADKARLLQLLVAQQVLQFGDFVLKSGRRSPYFFNLGAISRGAAIATLGEAYAARIDRLDLAYDTVFGPAYKGIPIAVATSEALARAGRDTGWSFNRKEAKDHGEGGRFVGAPVTGRVLLVDDVLTAGTAVREAVGLIRAVGGVLVGVVIALDRQERVAGSATAVQALEAEIGVPVASILTLEDVIEYLDLDSGSDKHPATLLAAMKAYQAEYCVESN